MTKQSLVQFAASPPRSTKRLFAGEIGQNQQLWDLGLDRWVSTCPQCETFLVVRTRDEAAVADKIREVEAGFQLVMLAERFPESLVLLASTLCWDLQDVTSLKLNGRSAERRQELSNVTRQQLRQFQRGDTLLYNHFAELFDQRVQKFGNHHEIMARKLSLSQCVVSVCPPGRARMAAAVLQLEAENRAVAASCSVQPEDNRRCGGPGLVLFTVDTDSTAGPVNMTGQTKYPTSHLAPQQGGNTNYFLPCWPTVQYAVLSADCLARRGGGARAWWDTG